jgi:2-methylisocitrate lyase-like PEP mutase family enzyme
MPLSQKEKAELFRAQHTAEKLLVLTNIWDPLSAKLIAALGYPSLATASVAMALANGYPDGEHIPYTLLIEQIKRITTSVDLPVSVDLERGFAEDVSQLKDNIKMLLDAGAIGLNIEDSAGHGKVMTPVAEQCRKIEAIREAGIQYGVPVMINARTDFFFQPAQSDTLSLVIERARAYQLAGADCFYPIMISSYHDIAALQEAVDIPLNILLFGPVRDMKELEGLGVSRISVGPGLMKVALSKMKNACEGLLNYQSDEFFEEGQLSFEFMMGLI